MNAQRTDPDITIEKTIEFLLERLVEQPPTLAQGNLNLTRIIRRNLVAYITLKTGPRTAAEEIVLDVDRALDELEKNSVPGARAMELRYFAHLDTQKIAQRLGRPVERVRQEMGLGRAMLVRELAPK